MSEKKKKSSEEENKEGFGHLSRREFLSDAGLIIGGSTMGSIAFASDTEAQQQAKESDVPDPCAEESTGTSTIELTVYGGKYRYRVEPHYYLESRGNLGAAQYHYCLSVKQRGLSI